MTNRELFISEINKYWDEVRSRDDLIFENIEIQLEADLRFDKLRDDNPQFYWEFIHENSLYNKKKMLREYFWDQVVGEFYENTLSIMKQAGLLEEAQKSFEKSYKIENTAQLILENGVFAKFNSKKKKELIDPLMEMSFYPHSFEEKHRSLLTENIIEGNMVIEEGWAGDTIIGAARSINSIILLLGFLLVSPATTLVGNVGTQAMDRLRGTKTPGTSPGARKFYSFLDHILVVKFLYKFLNKDLLELSNFLRKSNNLDNDYIQEVLKETGANPIQIVEKCWRQNNHQMSASNPQSAGIMEKMKHIFNGKGLANLLRNPQYANETQLAMTLKKDAADPTYQKMFYNFRICVYEKLFEIILGYAKAIYSMDDASYEIIKYANEVHKRKNYKAFFDLRPKQANEEAMFNVMKALIAIDDIANTLEKRKGELVADKYIDKFSEFLRQNIKQVYQQLDEMANQKKYNADRYEEEDPDDETKAKKIAEERFNAKKSIFM